MDAAVDDDDAASLLPPLPPVAAHASTPLFVAAFLLLAALTALGVTVPRFLCDYLAVAPWRGGGGGRGDGPASVESATAPPPLDRVAALGDSEDDDVSGALSPGPRWRSRQ